MIKYHRFCLFLLTWLFFSCTTIKNYPDPLGPKFLGDYREDAPVFNDTLKVVSFNIAHALKIDQATQELSGSAELTGADIILLQEMDESGTETIARSLKTNYLYYPVSKKDGKNFGNAILSRWPFSRERKYILPYDYPIKKSPRAAVSAVLQIGELEVLTYSVHTHTILLSEEKRLAQVDSLVKDISREWKQVIVGGDFNSPGTSNVEAIVRIFRQNGFQHASENSGTTVEVGPLDLTLDHIFSRGFEVVSTGALESSRASDHYPIWVKLVVH
jgi:endonuclease/exonuclease/phosphatase (EEP) superfamily protein YafD